MIKTSAKFFAHAIHVLLRNTLILFFVLFIAFFMWLLAGIRFDTFEIADYHVEGLYIKLDKKLVLEAQNVIIPQRKEDPSFTSVDETFDRINYILTFFQTIDLKQIIFNNNAQSIEFRHDYLRITSKDYEIVGKVRREGKIIKAMIPYFELKQHDVVLDGKFTYDLHEDILLTEGNFTISGASGKFEASKDGNDIDFKLNSDTFTDLRSIIDRFALIDTVRSWVVDKVQASHYKLNTLSGKGKIDNGKFNLDFDALKGEVLFTDAKIYFKEGLAPVLAPSFLLNYEYGGLYFYLKAPTYEDISLEGSMVSILNLQNADTNLKLKIRTYTPAGEKIKKLLEAYELEWHLLQENGNSRVLFMADISLKNEYRDYYVNVDFDKSDLWIGKAKFPVEKGIAEYHRGVVTLKNIYLNDMHYEGDLNGSIDIEKKHADLIFNAKRIELGDTEKKFFVLNDQTLPIMLDYKENIKLEIPKLYTKVISDENSMDIFLTDLSKIKPYLPDPGPIEQGGNVDIKTNDFKTFTFNGILKRSSCFLYEKDNQCQSRVPFEGKVTPTDLDFYAFSKRFYYNKASSRVQITNLNIDLDAFLKSAPKKTKKEDVKSKSKAKENRSLVILGEKSNLRYGEHKLVTDSYDIEVKPNGDIKAIGSSSDDIIKFSKKQELFSVKAFRIKDKTLHPLINFKGLQNGRYTLKILGDIEKTMTGQVIVEGGVMKDFKAYNNTLAFINTVPALASLKNPGYSKEGFIIEEGVAEYRMKKKDKIIFDSIYIKGTSATIAGTGEIDMQKKTIDLNLAIQTARELGKIVGSLPVVGYIITGGDKSITFGLQITGPLDNPIVKTSAGGDILSLPLKILKRAIESPGIIINK